MTEDELFEDVKYWKSRADAAEARLQDAMTALRYYADRSNHPDRIGGMRARDAIATILNGHVGSPKL